jgi:hypothetical protein
VKKNMMGGGMNGLMMGGGMIGMVALWGILIWPFSMKAGAV